MIEQVEAFCDCAAIIDCGQLVAVNTIDSLRDTTESGETVCVYVLIPIHDSC
jgi:ABC-2 type transport system ATP-binding protein